MSRPAFRVGLAVLATLSVLVTSVGAWSTESVAPAQSAVTVSPRAPVEYRLSFDQRAHHQARIEVTFRDLGPEPLELVMSRSSPGRYAVHNFAKNVYDFEASTPEGDPLEIAWATPHSWIVQQHGGSVVVGYTLYGDHCDGTYVQIDRSHAHLNMPASLIWAHGLEGRPSRVALDLPPGWRVATQLPEVKGQARGKNESVYSARDLQHLMDSPIEASAHQTFEWEIAKPADSSELSASSGVEAEKQLVRIALHHVGNDPLGNQQELEVLGRVTEAIVAEQIAVFGEAPRFDDGSYTFLADYLPWCQGDGMEHRNSTVLTSSSSLRGKFVDLVGTVSHEFFHTWSMERLRSRALEPFDFERANQSAELWFGEGFTSYYGSLILKRAGVLSLDRYAEALSSTVTTVVNAPGLGHRSAVEMSQQAPFVDDATSIDFTNTANTYLSYYSYGKALALALDLTLRSRFLLGLDDYMAELWRRFGRSETPYSQDDLRTTLGALVKDSSWADEFFRRFVQGSEIPDYKSLLEPAGFVVRHKNPDALWLGGAELRFDGSEIQLVSPSLEGDPLFLAGLDRGDRILELDGTLPASTEELEAWLDSKMPGDPVQALVNQRGESREVDIEPRPDPTLEVVPVEHLARSPSDRQTDFRQAWLSAKSDHRLGEERHCPICQRNFPADVDFCPSDGAALEWLPLAVAAGDR